MIDHGMDVIMGESGQAKQAGMIAIFDSKRGFFYSLFGLSANTGDL